VDGKEPGVRLHEPSLADGCSHLQAGDIRRTTLQAEGGETGRNGTGGHEGNRSACGVQRRDLIDDRPHGPLVEAAVIGEAR